VQISPFCVRELAVAKTEAAAHSGGYRSRSPSVSQHLTETAATTRHGGGIASSGPTQVEGPDEYHSGPSVGYTYFS